MRLGVSGHRGADLGGFLLPNPIYNKVCQEAEKHIKDLNPEVVITGMALCYDQWIANICKKLRVPYIAAIPFAGQEKMWNKESQSIYHRLIKSAKQQVIVSPGEYSARKMFIRNEYIVDNCDVLLACLRSSKTSGGTYQCVQYAKSKGKQIITIDPDSF